MMKHFLIALLALTFAGPCTSTGRYLHVQQYGSPFLVGCTAVRAAAGL